MFKLMHKKLNKKGFTLAELLIVVAIVAILVAIAIPIFTQGLEEAQIRTNEANLRSTRAAAVEHILANWNNKEGSGNANPDSGYDRYYRDGATKVTGLGGTGSKAPGWYAIGVVDAAGNLQDVIVRVNLTSGGNAYEVDPSSYKDGITTDDITAIGNRPGAQSSKYDTKIIPYEESGNISPTYYTFVIINDTDIK